MNEPKSILRLKQKFSQKPARSISDIDVGALLQQQTLLNAALGALFALVLLNALWSYSSLLFDRFHPWGSIVQGFLIGRAVRHFGRGLNWRFSLLAAAFAIAAAVTGSFGAALNLTAREFSVSALSLISEVSWHTVASFLTRDFGVIGLIYALTAAVIAAFYANRRLDRYEEVALQKHKETESV